MSRIFNPFSRRKKYSTSLILANAEIDSLKATIQIMKDQRTDILIGQKAVTSTFQKALDLGDYTIDRFEVSHKRGDIEKTPIPISVPKGGADISDILENLIAEGDFEIPFLGKKGKGMIVAMIRKNKEMINAKAEVVITNAMANMTHEQLDAAQAEYSNSTKEENK